MGTRGAARASELVVGASVLVVGASELVVGASELVVGASELVVGAAVLVVGAAVLVVGASELVVGASELVVGAAVLVVGAAELVVGAAVLVVGAAVLVVGAAVLVVGASVLVVGAAVLVVGASVLVVGASVLVVGASVLVVGASVLVVGAAVLVVGAAVLVVGASVLVVGAAVLVVGAAVLVVGGAPDAAAGSAANALTEGGVHATANPVEAMPTSTRRRFTLRGFERRPNVGCCPLREPLLTHCGCLLSQAAAGAVSHCLHYAEREHAIHLHSRWRVGPTWQEEGNLAQSVTRRSRMAGVTEATTDPRPSGWCRPRVEPASPRAARWQLRRVVRGIALGLLSTGIAVCGFVPYALFATRAPAERAQSQLARSFDRLHIVTRPGAPSPPAVASRRIGPPVTSPAEVVSWPAHVPLGTAIAKLSIAAAGVSNDVVVQGVDELRLEEGPGHYPGTALPGDPGNVAIAGHRTTWLRPFYDLQALRPGDPVTLRVGDLRYVYRVVSVRAVAPTDVSVLAPRRGWWLTLTTCNPRYSAAQRLVVQARRLVAAAPRARRQPLGAIAPPRTSPVLSARPRNRVSQLPPVDQVLPDVPLGVLVAWCLLAAVLTGAGIWAAHRRRAALLMLLPAAACCFEAYGAAVRLLPSSW